MAMLTTEGVKSSGIHSTLMAQDSLKGRVASIFSHFLMKKHDILDMQHNSTNIKLSLNSSITGMTINMLHSVGVVILIRK
jgi:hypothetical protein